MKSEQEVGEDGKNRGGKGEDEEVSLDPRLVKTLVEQVRHQTKTGRSLVQHYCQEDNNLEAI